MRTYLKFPYKCYLAAVAALILSSCKKQAIDTPSFDVSVTKTSFAVNEPITFTFSGTADIVSFYSGVTGSEYRYKGRTTVDGTPQLQFNSYRSGASTQTNTMSVLISKDFDNVFSIDDLQKATWTDITSRATLSTGVDNTPSGVIDLTDQMSGNTPIYLAFRYTAKNDPVVAQPTWAIKAIAINNVAANGTVTAIGTQSSISWGSISVLNPVNLWAAATTTSLSFTGGAINANDNEDWIISQPIQLNRAQATFAVNIKPSPTTKLTTYTFTGYPVAGTYTASFEAINANKWDTKSTVKEFTFTVK